VKRIFTDKDNDLVPAALDAEASGAFCGVSRAQWWKLHAMAKTPRPVYLGTKAPRWRREELEEWLAAGCPDRAAWERSKRQGKGTT
jgi:predicted DNA-binding transcriptional regulator AlpA